MKTTSIKITLPTRTDLAAALRLEVPSRQAEAVADAERAVGEVQQRIRDRSADIDRLRQDVARGRTPATDLERVLGQRSAAALLVAPLEAKVAEARRELADATERAKAGVLAGAGRLRDKLQEAADQVRPVLEEFRELERMLDQAAFAIGDKRGVPPVDWPQSLNDEGATRMIAASR